MSTARHEPRGRQTVDLLDPPFWDAYDPMFPDSDGKPMADNQTQYKWMVTIAEGLDHLFRDRDDVLIACDLLWYFDPTDPRRCIAPDVFVALGRPKAPRHSYKQWIEGSPPQVVFEIHSPSNSAAEMRRKRELYSDLGVEEYYYYFPESRKGRFEGWSRGPGGLEPIATTDGWTSPRLGVSFETPARKEGLILRAPDGEAFQHVQDIMKDRKAMRRLAKVERRRRKESERLADMERQRAAAFKLDALEQRERAEAERERAEAERERAEAAERRAERLAALLRELGAEPD